MRPGNGEILQKKEAMLLNPLQLAYLGDTVWETMIRYDLILRRLNVHHMHQECVKRVKAQAQAETLEKIHAELKEEEAEIVRRGRNVHAHHPPPKSQGIENYAAATGFEALIGYLYITGQDERLQEIYRKSGAADL